MASEALATTHGMSLKAFHVVFVTLATLLAAGFGAWSVLAWRSSGDGSDLTLGIASLVGAVALVVYGRWFLRKTRDVSYL